MQQIPFENLEIILSYLFDTSDLHKTIYSIRYLNKHFYEFTEQDRFWNILIELQLSNNCNLHQWFYKYLKISNDTIRNVNLNSKLNLNKNNLIMDDNEIVFQQLVIKWIDLFSKQEDYNNKLLRFLLKISLSQNVLEFVTPKNMISCFHYLFYKLLEPTLQLLNDNEYTRNQNEITIEKLFNLNILNFLQSIHKEEEEEKYNRNNYNNSIISYWRIIDPIYSIFPRDLLLNIIDNLSNVKINNNLTDNIASFIVKELFKTGLFIHLVDFKEDISFVGKNYKHLKPTFCKSFLLQHLACWKGNKELLQFCLNPDNKLKQIDELLNLAQNKLILKETGIISCFTMCNLTDNIGLTILHYAVKQRNEDLIKLLLLEYGANPFSRSMYHLVSPIELSILLNYDNLINLFKDIVGEEIVDLHLKNSKTLKLKDKKRVESSVLLEKEDNKLKNEQECNEENENNKTLEEVIDFEKEKKEEEYIIDLDEKESEDMKKIIERKRNEKNSWLCYGDKNTVIEMHSNFTLERSRYSDYYDFDHNIEPLETHYYTHQSDDDDEEEMISIHTIMNSDNDKTEEKILNDSIALLENVNSTISVNLQAENNFNEYCKIQTLLQPFETVENKEYMPLEGSYKLSSVNIGKRKFSEEIENNISSTNINDKEPVEKKLKLTNEEEQLLFKSNIVKRESLLISKLPFRRLVGEVGNYFRNEVPMTPMVLNLLQEGMEQFASQFLFSIANEIADFYGRDYLQNEDIKLVSTQLTKKIIIYKSNVCVKSLLEYIFWKSNLINLFEKAVESVYHLYQTNEWIKTLIIHLTNETICFNCFEEEEEVTKKNDYPSLQSINDEEDEDYISDGYSTDSNSSTVALHYMFEENNVEDYDSYTDLIYLSKEEKERKIQKAIPGCVEMVEDDEGNEIETTVFIQKSKPVAGRSEHFAFTNDRELALEWINYHPHLLDYNHYFH
ncbi:hypothetical protein ABK040_008136 [Willaertia magna]